MKRIFLIFFSLFFLAGCGAQNPSNIGIVKAYAWSSLPPIHKRTGTFLSNAMEATPIVWNNKVVVVSFDSRISGQFYIIIYDFFTGAEIARHAWNYGLGCAYVENGVLYCFGSSNVSIANNKVYMVSTTDLINWTAPVSVLNAPTGYTIYNTSVAPAASGAGYVMAYETNEFNPFTIRFATSPNLTTWTTQGNPFQPTTYAACPTIRYVNGYYQIVYLRQVDNVFVTFVARTTDFINYEYFNGNSKYPSTIQFLSPTDSTTEGNNNSDVDFVEFQGVTYGVYAIGDQRTWTNIRTFIYTGTINQLFNEFWGY